MMLLLSHRVEASGHEATSIPPSPSAALLENTDQSDRIITEHEADVFFACIANMLRDGARDGNALLQQSGL